MLRLVIIVLLCGVIGLWMVNHRTQASETLSFDQCLSLYKEARFEEATVAFKNYLQDHPDSPGGHWYLGRLTHFLHGPMILAAEGEFDMALALYKRTGSQDAFGDNDYFEIISYLEKAKVYLARLQYLEEELPLRSAMRSLFEQCWEMHDAAARVDPQHADVLWLEDILNDIGGSRYRPKPKPVDALKEGHWAV